jgi:two-component system, NtrC family, sensor histidine kinase PilS
MLQLSHPPTADAAEATEPASIRRRVLVQIALRLGIGLVLLAAAVAIELRSPETFPFEVVIAVLGLVFAISLAFIASLGWVEAHPWLADLYVASDTLVISMLVATTGGITSLFTPLYFLPIIAASSVRSRRGALEIAALSTVLYAGIVLLHYLSASGVIVLQPLITPRIDLPSGDVALYTLGLNVFSFVAVALLSGSLAERWRRADVQLVQASEDLADLQTFNAFVVDHLVSGLATADHENRVLTFNRAAVAITGESAEASVGRRAADLLQLTPADVSALESDGPGARARRIDVLFQRADGKVVDVGLSAARLQLPNGRLGYLYTFQDLTEVRRLERDAQIRQRLAAVGEMAAGISHEIRNPLGSMSGSLQILRQELNLTGDQAQLMDIVLKESERLNHTIRSFLTYARPERTIVMPVDLRTVLHEAVTLLRHSPDRDERHALLVSAPDEPVVIDADEGQVKQIVWNLATNGLRAMPSGGRLLLGAMWEPVGDEGRRAVLTVGDEGVGIPQEELDQIFQPFRGSFAKGSGLGLAIVQRIVSEHGATIAVESALGRGTTFRITFPRAAATNLAGEERPSGAPTRPPSVGAGL